MSLYRSSLQEPLMVRLALLGGGRIGKVHAATIAADPDAELAWVYDPIEPAASALAEQYGSAASTDADAVLADPTVAVMVGFNRRFDPSFAEIHAPGAGRRD